MNPGQEQFFNFILERTQDGKQDEAKTILEDAFEKQAAGTFSQEEMMAMSPKMIAVLKPEAVAEVQQIMSQFGSQHTS